MRSKRAFPVVVALGLALCATSPAKDDVSLSVSVDRGQMYLGESVVLSVKVDGTDDPSAAPDLSAIQNCTIEPLGSHSSSQSSISIVNGRMTRQEFRGREYAFRLTPTATGTITTGPVRLTVGGRTISRTGPPIRITGVEKQDWVELAVSASRESVLVDERFTVTLTVCLRQLPGPHTDLTPLNPSEPPVLTVPYLGQELPGLTSDGVERRLESLLVRQRGDVGFAINEYTSRRDPFDSFFSFGGDPFGRAERAQFALPRRQVDRNGKSYWEYKLSFEYVPREEGQHTFGPVLFKGPVVTAVNAQMQGSTRNVFAVGAAATVRVVPPPEEGRPGSYVGVLGSNLTVSASLDAQTCNVGDPLQLTIRVGGAVNLDKLRPPPIWEQADLLRDFRLYQETLQTQRDPEAVSYTFTVRPQVAGTIELPPIPVSYYDSAKRAYQTVASSPIPLRVNQVEVLRPEYVLNVSTNAAGMTERGLEVGPVAPLDMSPSGYVSVPLLGGRPAVVVASAGPLACLLTMAFLLGIRMVRSRSRGTRPREALRHAKRELRAIGDEAPDEQEGRRRLAGVLRRYVSERLADGQAGMTPKECSALLRARGIPSDLANEFGDALGRHFNAGFVIAASTEWDLSGEASRTSDLLDRVEAACRNALRKQEGA